MSTHRQLAQLMTSFRQHPAFSSCTFSAPTSLPPPISLSLTTHTRSLKDELLPLGCTPETIAALEHVFQQASSRLDDQSRQAFIGIVGDLRCSDATEDVKHLQMIEGVVATAITTEHARKRTAIHEKIVQEVFEAKARQSSSSSFSTCLTSFDHQPPSLTADPIGAFTEEVVSILQKAFEINETLSRAEVKGLMQVTGLNNKQIRTWFANARQRKGRKAAPYLVPRRPARHSFHPGPVRSVSNSSNSSFSSLVSYASSVAEQPPLPPQLDQSPPAARMKEEEDSPMDLSISNQVTLPQTISIPTETGPFHLSSIPPAPSTAETDQFFSAQQQESFLLPLPALPPTEHSPTRSSSFFDLHYSPSSSTNSANGSLSFLDQLQSTDSFLDDQFLKNVFGTLGVTQGSGLTLTMDSFSEEELNGQVGGGNGGGFEFGEKGGTGGNEMVFGW
ncbi:homeobox domain-containing protein [Sporobolomyces salmoneus]|uniref:homeobox domain-containing protein n=1 Tax=Sporobolomyces salmoneus TaxID=183962 RepID=UPI0031811718